MFMYSCSASRVACDMYIVMAAYLSVEQIICYSYMLVLDMCRDLPACSFDS